MAGEEAQDPLIGARIGPCRVETRLAAGGMGVVYRARHLQLGQDVAVKILSPSLAQDQEYVTRFFREAGAAGQIDHPNVVRVIDVGKHEDRYFLFNEQGDLIIAKLSPNGYEEVSRAHIIDPTNTMAGRGRKVVWMHPAFADRCVFAKNDQELVCVSLAKRLSRPVA